MLLCKVIGNKTDITIKVMWYCYSNRYESRGRDCKPMWSGSDLILVEFTPPAHPFPLPGLWEKQLHGCSLTAVSSVLAFRLLVLKIARSCNDSAFKMWLLFLLWVNGKNPQRLAMFLLSEFLSRRKHSMIPLSENVVWQINAFSGFCYPAENL